VYRSAELVALVPLAVVTVISTAVAAVPAGMVAVINVGVIVPMVAETVPNFTAVAPFKLVPVMLIVPPPAAVP
jgi:hypothetical protein